MRHRLLSAMVSCVGFSHTLAFDNVAVAIIKGRRQRIENDRFIT
jgi:hypothetical protein